MIGPLNEAEFSKIKNDLRKKGIDQVIDAQNPRSSLRKNNNATASQEPKRYNKAIAECDDVLNSLSLKPEKVKDILSVLSDKKNKKEDVRREDIDWKKLRTF